MLHEQVDSHDIPSFREKQGANKQNAFACDNLQRNLEIMAAANLKAKDDKLDRLFSRRQKERKRIDEDKQMSFFEKKTALIQVFLKYEAMEEEVKKEYRLEQEEIEKKLQQLGKKK